VANLAQNRQLTPRWLSALLFLFHDRACRTVEAERQRFFSSRTTHAVGWLCFILHLFFVLFFDPLGLPPASHALGRIPRQATRSIGFPPPIPLFLYLPMLCASLESKLSHAPRIRMRHSVTA